MGHRAIIDHIRATARSYKTFILYTSPSVGSFSIRNKCHIRYFLSDFSLRTVMDPIFGNHMIRKAIVHNF